MSRTTRLQDPHTRARWLTATATAALLVGTVGASIGDGPADAGPAPANRTYFTIFVGLNGPYVHEGDCLDLTATEICTSKGVCGEWEYTQRGRTESAIAFEIVASDNDVEYRIDGHARVDSRRKNDSLAAVARFERQGRGVNFALAGRSTTRPQCDRLLRDLRNSPSSLNAACVARAAFEAPATTPYVLPYRVGDSSSISQSYCFATDSHSDSFAYDFRLPIGARVVAARAGTVTGVEDDFPDDPWAARSNAISIGHDDGTTAVYVHLRRNGARVEVGDRVAAGQVIALSGDSSSAGIPHLHFEVFQGTASVPVSFRNVDGTLDERGGLMFGYTYTALPY